MGARYHDVHAFGRLQVLIKCQINRVMEFCLDKQLLQTKYSLIGFKLRASKKCLKVRKSYYVPAVAPVCFNVENNVLGNGLYYSTYHCETHIFIM